MFIPSAFAYKTAQTLVEFELICRSGISGQNVSNGTSRYDMIALQYPK